MPFGYIIWIFFSLIKITSFHPKNFLHKTILNNNNFPGNRPRQNWHLFSINFSEWKSFKPKMKNYFSLQKYRKEEEKTDDFHEIENFLNTRKYRLWIYGKNRLENYPHSRRDLLDSLSIWNSLTMMIRWRIKNSFFEKVLLIKD